MASLKTSVRTEQTVELEPDVQQRLSATLRTYLDIKEQVDVLTELLEDEKKKIVGELDLAGVKKAVVDGTPVTIMSQERPYIDRLEFVKLGGSLTILDQATRKKATKPFLRVGADKEGKEP